MIKGLCMKKNYGYSLIYAIMLQFVFIAYPVGEKKGEKARFAKEASRLKKEQNTYDQAIKKIDQDYHESSAYKEFDAALKQYQALKGDLEKNPEYSALEKDLTESEKKYQESLDAIKKIPNYSKMQTLYNDLRVAEKKYQGTKEFEVFQKASDAHDGVAIEKAKKWYQQTQEYKDFKKIQSEYSKVQESVQKDPTYSNTHTNLQETKKVKLSAKKKLLASQDHIQLNKAKNVYKEALGKLRKSDAFKTHSEQSSQLKKNLLANQSKITEQLAKPAQSVK